MEFSKVTSKRCTHIPTTRTFLTICTRKLAVGRSAAVNMVITETGAGAAVTKVMPGFKDKLTANAVRVPTPNGSLAILSLELNKETSIADLNASMKRAALEGNLINQIHYSIAEDLVSNDIIGNTCCSVYDSCATIVHPNGKKRGNVRLVRQRIWLHQTSNSLGQNALRRFNA